MAGSSRTDLRAQVFDLLERATDYKLMMGGEAMELLLQARDLADQLQPGTPWREIVAYRLAHLYLRNGDAQTADELLAIAQELPVLAPYPSIYRIATAHRLGRPTQTAFQVATQHLREMAVGPVDLPRAPERAGIQSLAHNMLELAGYLVGVPYGLQGLGGPWEQIFPKTSQWVLVGPEPALARVRYARNLALAELRSLAAPEVLVFEVSGSAGQWQLGHSPPSPVPPSVLRLLAVLLEGRCRTTAEIQVRLWGASGADIHNNYRQAKNNLKLALEGVCPGCQLKADRGQAPQVVGLRVYGALPAGLLAGHLDR